VESLNVLFFTNRNNDQKLQQLPVRIDQYSADLYEISSAYVYWLLHYLHCKITIIDSSSSDSLSQISSLIIIVFVQFPAQHLHRGVQGKPFLEQMHWPLLPALQEHLMSSIKLTACGAGRARHLTAMYSAFFALDPFASIGGRSGQLIL